MLIASKIDLSLQPAALSYLLELFSFYLRMFHHLQQFCECYFCKQGGMWKETVVTVLLSYACLLWSDFKKHDESFVRVATSGLKFELSGN
jgi:hypothetical protein